MNLYRVDKLYYYILLPIIILILSTFTQLLLSNGSTTLVLQVAIAQQQQLPNGKNNTSSLVANTINNTSDFLTYNNPILGVRIQYPSNWTVVENPYNPVANNTIVGFFAQTKTSSELGNISGVSGDFVPYLDIYVFDSKNISFDKIINGTINKFRNNENFVISETKPYAVKGNHPAYMLVYDAIVGGDEFFRKMQVYVMSGSSKIYLISFTSQQALFSNYLPIVRKMVNSFDLLNTDR